MRCLTSNVEYYYCPIEAIVQHRPLPYLAASNSNNIFSNTFNHHRSRHGLQLQAAILSFE